MEFALLAVAALGLFIGYRVGYAKGVKVNRPAPVSPTTPRPRYDEDLDLR